MEKQAGLTSLPDEMLEMICSFLSFRDIISLENACSSIHQSIAGTRVWKYKCLWFHSKFKYPFVSEILAFMKGKKESRQFKVIIGI